MLLKKMLMEEWFMKTASCKYNFAESGIPDFTMAQFLKKIGVDWTVFKKIYLGNNDTRGSYSLRKQIAQTYTNVDFSDILVTNGTSEALYIFLNLFAGRGKTVFSLRPAFPPLYLIPRALRSRLYWFDALRYAGRNKLLGGLLTDFKKIKPDFIIINIPHNPLGFSLNKDEIIAIGKAAKKYNSFILFDEHYRFLPLDNPPQGISLSGYDVVSTFYNNVATVGSVIKCTGIVGVRLGWLIAGGKKLQAVRNYKDYTTHCVSLINETIVMLALQHADKITAPFIERIKRNLSSLEKSILIKQKKISLDYKVEGGCVCFPKINEKGSLPLAEKLSRDYNISVMPGDFLGKKGYIRINLAQEAKHFKLLLNALNKLCGV